MSSNAEEMVRFHCPKSKEKELLSVLSLKLWPPAWYFSSISHLGRACRQTPFRVSSKEQAAKLMLPPPFQSKLAIFGLYIEGSLKLTFASKDYCFCVVFLTV